MSEGTELAAGLSIAKRAEAVALQVWDYSDASSEVAKYLRRDQANISTMLSRLSARQMETF